MRSRLRRRLPKVSTAASLVALCAACVSCGRVGFREGPTPPQARPPASGAAVGMVTGVVRELGSKLPLGGALVAIAGQKTSTDASGHFTLPVSTSTYDVLLLDADGTSASFYVGLTRSELALVHRRTTDSLPPPGHSQVHGLLSGGVGFPLSGPGGRSHRVRLQ